MESLQWAAAGSNVTVYLTAVDPIHLNIGSVLCPLNDVIPLATSFTARIIVFDIQVPIIAGASVSDSTWSFRLILIALGRIIPPLERYSCEHFEVAGNYR